MKELVEAIRADSTAAAKKIVAREPELAKKPQVVLDVARFARAEILEALLAAGGDRDAKDDHGFTALDFARVHGKRELVALLENRAAPARPQSPKRR
ncbi:MAG: ankyrin repeat domain-containing protein [Planctomycetes bacterium]|nr:ankyrin repeat domain-containing protein [Planctomycetota bacterium]